MSVGIARTKKGRNRADRRPMPKEPLRSTMARKSERLSTGTGSGAAHKRVASTTAIPRSEAKRPKTKKATPTKSQHFQADEDAEDEEGEPSSGDDDVESAFDDDGDASSSEAEPVDDGFNSGSPRLARQRKILELHLHMKASRPILSQERSLSSGSQRRGPLARRPTVTARYIRTRYCS